MTTPRYSDTAIESVGKWLRDGFSASQIAAALTGAGLETSRSAAVALVHRNKTLREIGFARSPGGSSPRKASKAAGKPAERKSAFKTPALPSLMPTRALLAARDDIIKGADPLQFRTLIHRPRAENLGDTAAYDREGLHVPLTDLGGGCRFPVSEPEPREHRFCGHPREEGRSYCRHHYLRSVQCR